MISRLFDVGFRGGYGKGKGKRDKDGYHDSAEAMTSAQTSQFFPAYLPPKLRGPTTANTVRIVALVLKPEFPNMSSFLEQ